MPCHRLYLGLQRNSCDNQVKWLWLAKVETSISPVEAVTNDNVLKYTLTRIYTHTSILNILMNDFLHF